MKSCRQPVKALFRTSKIVPLAFLGAISLSGQTGASASPALISPKAVADGRIAFESGRAGQTTVYLMNADGSNQTRLTEDDGNTEPNISRDGNKVVFVSLSVSPGNSEIFSINSDGTGLKRLTNNTSLDWTPVWSPDGSKIAFTSDRDGDYDLYVMDADGSNQRKLTNNTFPDFGPPTWSPDGKKIAFESNRTGVQFEFSTYVINVDGTNDKRLFPNLSTTYVNNAWSPDGNKMAFRDYNGYIYTINIDGTNLKQMTSGAVFTASPTWSPDGSQLGFVSSPNVGSTGYSFYTVNADGTNLTRVTGPGSDVQSPSWGLGRTQSSSDKPIAYDQNRNVSEEVPTALTLTGFEPNGLPLTYTLLSNPAHGTLSGTAPDLTYTSDVDYNGPDSFTFKVNNGINDSATATFSMYVQFTNDAPKISPISDQMIDEDSSTSVLSFTLSDDSTLPQNLSVSASSDNPTLFPANGIVLGGSNANRTIKLKPASNQFGTANITIQTKDVDDTIGTTTFRVTVNPVNDLPTISNVANQSMLEDGNPLKVNFVVGDIETPLADLLATASSSNQQLFDANGINLSGSGAQRVLTLQPRPNAFGLATITVKVTDNSGATVEKSFVVDVKSVNDSPVVFGQTLTTTLGTPLVITLTGTDVEGETLTFQLSSGNGLPFTVQQGNQLTFTATNPGTYTINFVAFDQTGASSSPATITITVPAPQGTKVSGTILSYKPGINAILTEPVPNVVIRLEQKGQTRYTLTTVNGTEYSAYGIAPGEYAARVFPASGGKFLPFDPLFQAVKVKKNVASVTLKPFALYSVFGQVTAIVKSGKTKTIVPVPGASITATMNVSGSLPITKTAITDANGFYSVSDFPKGKVILLVSRTGVTMPNKGKYSVGLPSNAKPNKPIARFDVRGTATSSFTVSTNPSIQRF